MLVLTTDKHATRLVESTMVTARTEHYAPEPCVEVHHAVPTRVHLDLDLDASWEGRHDWVDALLEEELAALPAKGFLDLTDLYSHFEAVAKSRGWEL